MEYRTVVLILLAFFSMFMTASSRATHREQLGHFVLDPVSHHSLLYNSQATFSYSRYNINLLNLIFNSHVKISRRYAERLLQDNLIEQPP